MDIIELLNDFSSGSIVDEVFLGEDGQPTDRFLEALKLGHGSSRTKATSSASAIAIASTSKPALAERVKTAVNLAAPNPTKEPSAGSSNTERHQESASVAAEKGEKEQLQTVLAVRRSREAHLVVHRKPMYGVPRASKAARMRMSHGCVLYRVWQVCWTRHFLHAQHTLRVLTPLPSFLPP